MKSFYSTQAIVLKRFTLPNGSGVVTMFTKDFGKMSFIIPHLRSRTNRRSSLLQTGNIVELVLCKQKGQDRRISQVRLLSAISILKTELETIEMVYALLFLVDRIMPLEETEHEVYSLMLHYFIQLTKTDEYKKLFLSTSNILLHKLGYLEKPLDSVALIRYIQELIDDRIPYGTIYS